MKSKRLLCLLLALAMVLSVTSVSIFADEAPAEDNDSEVTADHEEITEDDILTPGEDQEDVQEEPTPEPDEDNSESEEPPVTDDEEEPAQAPTAITIEYNSENVLPDGKIVCRKGDSFTLTAYDQDGKETPVTWRSTSFGNTFVIDEVTGVAEVIGDIYSGGTSFLYFTATSVLDETVSEEITIKATGFIFSDYQREQTVALSADGQTAKTASASGGLSGYNIWSYDIPEGIAELSADPGTGGSIRFNVFRPGTITATFALDFNEELSDTATITVTGVAVEDEDGNRTKTYLSINADEPEPVKQLSAFVMEGRTIEAWESADTAVAEVSEDGLVTAKGVGSTIITATDDEGTTGGIKVVVESEDIPYFESLEFSANAFESGAWVTGETFFPTRLEYDLPIRVYSTSSLILQASTLYDADKYTAVAEYTDINGNEQSITVNSGKMTTLPNQPFDESVLTITLADNNDAENKTVYTFNVHRPRDTTKAIKSGGIVLVPADRALSGFAYQGVTEGTMRKADESGELTSGTGVSSNQYYYRTFIYDDAGSFKLNLTSSTAYAHIRYSIDGGEWTELPQGGGATDEIPVPESTAAEIVVQIVDDSAYTENVISGKDGFDDAEPAEYIVWVDSVSLSTPVMLTAEATGGDWYPAFSPERYSYWLVAGNQEDAPVLTYTVADGNTVKIGANEQEPDEDGKYTLALGTSQTSITVISEDGQFSSIYKFGYRKRSVFDVPDRVADYLCMGSQYTNGNFGVSPEGTLCGSLVSLGNFGGYITYYYEDPITDDPRNKYGMDFYVIGNSQDNNDSIAELGQVYVSEDGESWYALAGSEHYEDKAIWDYTITYTKGSDGKAYWTDNYGNSIDYAAKAWPSASVYYMNNVANEDSYTFTGILFKSQLGSIMGDGSTGSYAAKARFGYADYYASNAVGTTLTDVNSYVENPSKANGFDVAWAVDEDGIPVDVSEKEFHYIRVATASNIYAGAFMEKSTEVAYVARTTAQDEEVGKTDAPAGVTISDGADSKTVNLTEDQRVYSVNLGGMKYVSVTVNAADDDNIYVNNQRVASGISAEGFKVTKNGETLVRIIVQNGDKEPAIYLLKLTGSADESDELIEGIKINASGTVREAATKNGIDYTASVGYRISSISVVPVATQNVTLTVNGEDLANSYSLDYGSNVFEITATDADGNSQTVILTVKRENAPTTTGKSITVYFTLYGDEKHRDSEVHTYKSDKKKLPVWISQKSYTVDSGMTVLDVFEKALTEAELTWENDGGNYISKIDGLAEFDNGSLSGWMYLLNGSYSDLGLAEQTLKNGDKIIFHYTDDYTQEQGSEKWQPSRGSSSEIYTVKFETNGAGEAGSQSISKNGTVSEPDAPVKDGYIFAGWYTDEELLNEYDFSSKVTSSFTLYAKWTEVEKTTDKAPTGFNDVDAGSWYEEAVAYAVKNDLFKGISETEFAPDSEMTRAMLVTVLYRLEGPEEKERTHGFTDVTEGEWYAEAVAWAAECGVVNGVSSTEFAPNDSITREQLATIIYRYARLKGYDAEELAELSEFTDATEISGYALDAVRWANAAGLVNGVSETSISPKTTASRAQVAAILMRFCENVMK